MRSPQNTKKMKKKLIAALQKNMGLVTASCKEVGISTVTYYSWLKNDEAFKEKVEEINEGTIDFVEGQLYKKIEQGSEKSILFYMRYKGKKRGYTDSIDITTNGEKINNIQIEIIKKKDDDINE